MSWINKGQAMKEAKNFASLAVIVSYIFILDTYTIQMYNDIYKSDSQLQAPHLNESESHDLQLITGDSTLLCMLMQLLLYYT